MGQDKAGLIIGGTPLWRRQLATLRETGATEIFISGPVDGPYSESGMAIMEDAEPGLGPIGGLVTAIASARHELVLVLAIDLPRMTSGYLQSLLADAPVVPRRGDRFEPLSIVYTRCCGEVFQHRLAQRRLSLQSAIHHLIERGELYACDVSPAEASLFDNLNTPEDLAYFIQAE